MWRVTGAQEAKPYHASIIKISACVKSFVIPSFQAMHLAKPNTLGAEKYTLPSKRDYKSHGKGCGYAVL